MARAHADASANNGAAVHADLGAFVADVRTLTSSGQLSHFTAGRLDREARAAAAQAAQLHPEVAGRAGTAQAATATATPTPTPTPTTPPAQPNRTAPAPKRVPPGQRDHHGPGPNASDPSWPGRGPGHGHGYGHKGWIKPPPGAATGAVTEKAWKKWWNHVTGGGGSD